MNPKEYEISIVSPAYNEEEGIGDFCQQVSRVLEDQGLDYEIICVDDGSQDRTFDILKGCHAGSPQRIKVVKLARNFGHQAAITAGLNAASGRAVVVMDSDLQDPPQVVADFIAQWRGGCQIVYGVRTKREGETFFKKATAKIFYKFIHWATNVAIPEDVGDFYLLDRQVVNILKTMPEQHRFLRGMVAWTGFKKSGVGYVRKPRLRGKTKFHFWKMLKFSIDAATSFSFFPLRVISLLGFVISALSCAGIALIVYIRLFTQRTITGWSSLMVAVLFLGGIQLLAVGVIGEYIARIGDDVKRRPLYTVETFLS